MHGPDDEQVIHRLEYARGKYPPLRDDSPRPPRKLSVGHCLVGLVLNCAAAAWAVHRCARILDGFSKAEGGFLWESPKRAFYGHEAFLPSDYALVFIWAMTLLFVLLLVGRRTHGAMIVFFILGNLCICLAMGLELDNTAMAYGLYP